MKIDLSRDFGTPIPLSLGVAGCETTIDNGAWICLDLCEGQDDPAVRHFNLQTKLNGYELNVSFSDQAMETIFRMREDLLEGKYRYPDILGYEMNLVVDGNADYLMVQEKTLKEFPFLVKTGCCVVDGDDDVREYLLGFVTPIDPEHYITRVEEFIGDLCVEMDTDILISFDPVFQG